MINTTFLEFSDTRTRVLPLFPDDGAQSAPDPVVDGAKTGSHIGMAEIVPPPFRDLVEPCDHLPDAQPATAAGAFAYPLFKCWMDFEWMRVFFHRPARLRHPASAGRLPPRVPSPGPGCLPLYPSPPSERKRYSASHFSFLGLLSEYTMMIIIRRTSMRNIRGTRLS